jgi:hypothetical protein
MNADFPADISPITARVNTPFKKGSDRMEMPSF